MSGSGRMAMQSAAAACLRRCSSALQGGCADGQGARCAQPWQ